MIYRAQFDHKYACNSSRTDRVKTKILGRNIHLREICRKARNGAGRRTTDGCGRRTRSDTAVGASALVPFPICSHSFIAEYTSTTTTTTHTHTALDWSVTKQHAGWERNGGEGNSIDFSSSGRWTADQGARLLQRGMGVGSGTTTDAV